jgi:hypothetical protein
MKDFESVGEIQERIEKGSCPVQNSGIRYSKGRQPLTTAARWVIGNSLVLSRMSQEEKQAKIQKLAAAPYQMGLPFSKERKSE